MPIVEYKKVDNSHGCCINNNEYHRTCGREVSKPSTCPMACDVDINCRGFAYESRDNFPLDVCFIATTSNCPTNWSMDGRLEVVGELMDGATCGSSTYTGCFIKQGL